MRRLLVALALAALVVVPVHAVGGSGGYSHPPNVGVKQPFTGVPSNVETVYLEFTAAAPFNQFVATARDYLDEGTWMHVCVRYFGQCVGEASGSGVVSITFGNFVPAGAVARVWVYSLHVWADGEVNPGTWGGVRGQFLPGAQTDDVVPYTGAGAGGQLALGIPYNLRVRCGHYVSAQCATVPMPVKTVRIWLRDDVTANVDFEACIMQGDVELLCNPATNLATLTRAQPFPAGTEVDIRPYNSLGAKLSSTKGHALITYIP